MELHGRGVYGPDRISIAIGNTLYHSLMTTSIIAE
jgi:hypothetical protein